MPVELHTRIRRTDPAPLFSEIDGEVVMLDVASGNYYTLDSVGTDIWRRLDDAVSVEALCDALEDEYEADRSTIRRDVIALLDGMLDKGLISAET